MEGAELQHALQPAPGCRRRGHPRGGVFSGRSALQAGRPDDRLDQQGVSGFAAPAHGRAQRPSPQRAVPVAAGDGRAAQAAAELGYVLGLAGNGLLQRPHLLAAPGDDPLADPQPQLPLLQPLSGGRSALCGR